MSQGRKIRASRPFYGSSAPEVTIFTPRSDHFDPSKWSFWPNKVVSLRPQLALKIWKEALKIAKSKAKNEENRGNGGGKEGSKSKNDRFSGIANADFGHYFWIFRRQTQQNFFLGKLRQIKTYWINLHVQTEWIHTFKLNKSTPSDIDHSSCFPPRTVCHNGQSASLLSAFGLGHVL